MDGRLDYSGSNESRYGEAWLLIANPNKTDQGISMMRELSDAGFIEASVSLAMFCDDPSERKELVKRAADKGNPEGIWEYCGFLSHSYILNPNKKEDALWEKYCSTAAEKGIPDAMIEMGNVYNRRQHLAESMYWYAMAYYYDHPQGFGSMKGIAHKWNMMGCPRRFNNGSTMFDTSRNTCAMTLLELHSDNELSGSFDDIIKLVLDGIPLAGYFAGEMLEDMNNHEMAYRMYNALAIEHDAHAIKCCADMLMTGKGVQQDSQRAIQMYFEAAELGERSAMFVAGEFLKQTNKKMAAYWFGLSHSRGFEHSFERLKQITQ